MKYRIETSKYNAGKYGVPWLSICRTAFLTKDYEYVGWQGKFGKEGFFEFDAEPGQIIARGQRNRNNNRSWSMDGYFICMPDGSIVKLNCNGQPNAKDLRHLSFIERLDKILIFKE